MQMACRSERPKGGYNQRSFSARGVGLRTKGRRYRVQRRVSGLPRVGYVPLKQGIAPPAFECLQSFYR